MNVNAPVVFTYPAPDPSGIRTAEDSIAAPVAWKPVVYTGSMVAYGKVTFNDKGTQAGDVIGVFVKGECRAIAAVNNDEGFSLVSMVINGKPNDTLEFRLFRNNQYYISDFHTIIKEEENITNLLPLTFRGVNPSLEEKAMEVYPNPISNQMMVHIHLENNKVGTLTLWDALGKSIFETQVSGTQVLEWNVPKNLAGGVYHLRLQSEDKRWSQKVVIER